MGHSTDYSCPSCGADDHILRGGDYLWSNPMSAWVPVGSPPSNDQFICGHCNYHGDEQRFLPPQPCFVAGSNYLPEGDAHCTYTISREGPHAHSQQIAVYGSHRMRDAIVRFLNENPECHDDWKHETFS